PLEVRLRRQPHHPRRWRYHSASLLSSRGPSGWRPRPRRDRTRRERRAREQSAALEKEAQLAQRERPSGRGGTVRCPQCREAALLEALVVDAEPRAVPQQDLRPRAQPIDEEKAVAGERILAERRHEPAEPVEALPQIRRGGIRPHAQGARAADHPSARSNALAVATSRPSTR